MQLLSPIDIPVRYATARLSNSMMTKQQRRYLRNQRGLEIKEPDRHTGLTEVQVDMRTESRSVLCALVEKQMRFTQTVDVEVEVGGLGRRRPDDDESPMATKVTIIACDYADLIRQINDLKGQVINGLRVGARL